MPRRNPAPGGTDAKAAKHSPAGAGRLETPAGGERGSRLNGHTAAGTGVLPGGKTTHSDEQKCTVPCKLHISFLSKYKLLFSRLKRSSRDFVFVKTS